MVKAHIHAKAHWCASTTLRICDQVVAALCLPYVVEPVWHVGFEVEGVSLLQQVGLVPEDGLQSSLLHDYVLFDAPAVWRELAGAGSLGYDVPCELDPTPAEARREQLSLKARPRISHRHAPLPPNHDDLPLLFDPDELRQAHP